MQRDSQLATLLSAFRGLLFLRQQTSQGFLDLLQTDRPAVLRQMIESCRKGGTLSIVGVYGGLIDKFPMGAAMNKGLTFRMGQQNGQRYAERLFEHIRRGDLDPSYLLTHRMPLDEGPQGYRMFKEKADGCMRVVFAPQG